MGESITFEKADQAKINELVKIRMEYLYEDYGNIKEHDRLKIINSLPAYFEKHLNKDLFAYVAYTEQIVATAFLLVVEKPANPGFITGRTGTVLNVYTKPEFRRKGIAQHLMEMLLTDAQQLNLDFVELKATKEGHTLYKNIGFGASADKYIPMKYRFSYD